MPDGLFEQLEEVDEFVKLHSFMDDEEVRTALLTIRKAIKDPHIAGGKLSDAILKIQALGAQFQVLAMFYRVMEKGTSGSDEYKKKNVYYTLYDTMDKLAAAMKYQVREG